MVKKTGCFTIILLFFIIACKHEKDIPKELLSEPVSEAPEKPSEIMEFGFNLNDYLVKKDTLKEGDNFGEILTAYDVSYPKIFEIAQKTKDSFDIRTLRAGKQYTILFTKDTLQKPQHFIYQPNTIDYIVINLTDSIHAYKERKPVKMMQRQVSGVITSSLYDAFKDQNPNNADLANGLTNSMADIYAWTIDFFRLQQGDRFKICYTEKYINDTIYAGIGSISAAYFQHKGKPFYAFLFEADTINNSTDYFDDTGKNLRRSFLKAPLRFKDVRVSSRYNLRRRIAYYGNKIRPHLGTDFAAPVGTPIIATANGTVIKSTRGGGNGNYVKIKHNSTYATQYLHMKKRAVKTGHYVKQGDIIGWVGMTGYTSGPHVCYRFWKNGKQVDPFREELPEIAPLTDTIKTAFLSYITPIKEQLDAIPFDGETKEFITELILKNDPKKNKPYPNQKLERITRTP